MKMLLTLAAFTLSIQANAGLDVADAKTDLALLRKLAPAGSDVAQVQTALIRGETIDSALEYAQGNYLIQDFNRDGVRDVLVIFEQDPQLLDENGKSCAKEDWQTGCHITYGDRVMQFWIGKAQGGFKMISENRVLIMRADEGGVFGEPLDGLSVNNKGSVVLHFYGGSAWRWGFSYTFQFRTNDFYLIGLDTYYGWNMDGRYDTTSINYLTGKKIRSWAETGDAPEHTTVTKLPLSPLVQLSHVEPAEIEESSPIDSL